jgi:hypothetical protein
MTGFSRKVDYFFSLAADPVSQEIRSIAVSSFSEA